MTTQQFNFRAGYLENEDQIPPLSEIKEVLDKTDIVGTSGNRRWVRRVQYDEEHELLYFIFLKEIETTLRVYNEDEGAPGEEEVFPLRSMKVIMGSGGNYVYESVQAVSHQQAMDFVFSLFDEEEVEAKEHGSLNRTLMLDFYNNYLDQVKRFKVEDIGKREPNPGPIRSELREILDGYGDVIDNSEHSVGREDNDARQNDLAHAFAETSEVQRVRGEDEDGRTQELTLSGIFRTRYDDEDMTPEEESNFVVSRVSEVFGDIFDGSD
jgi:hypothetical protein